jgi:predicted dehydrogenase
MSKRLLRIAMLGAGKMAKAHSQAYLTAARFFDLPVEPLLNVIVGHSRERTEQVARAFGWHEVAYDWRTVVTRADVDLVDVCTPNTLHAEPACAAAEAGKAVICEKPLAADVPAAEAMVQAVERCGVANMVIFNYRYAPAVREARRLIAEGVLGDIRHFRLHFLQDWLMDPGRLMSWRLSMASGGGVLLDLGAHLIDMLHHLVGPISGVAATQSHHVSNRPGQAGSVQAVDVEDVVHALMRARSGATGTLTVSRVAGGYACENGFEIIGSRGSLRWELQHLNELAVYVADEPPALRGWRTLSVTQPSIHPWADTWWGGGHPLGYAETFVHQLAEFLRGLNGSLEVECSPPSFADGLQCQRVMAAIARAARSGQWEEV